MAEEVELKLALAPHDLSRLPASAMVRALATGPGTTKRLSATYYDTPSLTLRRHGIALRVRRDGNRLTQTLKAPLTFATAGSTGPSPSQVNGNGLQHLREFEAELGSDQPDLTLIDDGELQELFREEALVDELEPVFTTTFDRRTVPLEMADSTVELALDQGDISVADDREEICEAELELQAGRPSRLYELALMLSRDVSFRLENRSKAARGYQLYAAEPPKPYKAGKPLLAPGMTVAEAFTQQARSCIDQVRANEAAVLDGSDPEGVHQMRVGLRRLRALVTVYKSVFAEEPYTFLRTELRWLQQQLGPAREWDVFLKETLAPLRNRLPSEDSLEILQREVHSLQRTAYEQARTAVIDPRTAELLLRLELWLAEGGWRASAVPGQSDQGDSPVEPFARATLAKRAKKVTKLGRRHDTLSEGELHRLRIQCKKLRYAAEFFAGLFPKKPTKRYLKGLEAIQDRLGAVNDAATGQRLLDDLDRRLSDHTQTHGQGGEALAANATGIVLGWQAALMDRELQAFHATWDQFAAQKAFWKKG
ncbi:CYTH and CHAD domain-containing protein [Rhodovibrio salinarum]|uniref:Inorganic triphosphatase n=1 Tax=Rhodovibrio salinarum TaxID=1087 RepID=A0A934QJ58_9PROT|nr:CYTH and CHAD domain-containing protein [Rhodovibrio salinarum]MBK1697520.1 inorganic triphosphatase [Rhodovibrio salinarum]